MEEVMNQSCTVHVQTKKQNKCHLRHVKSKKTVQKPEVYIPVPSKNSKVSYPFHACVKNPKYMCNSKNKRDDSCHKEKRKSVETKVLGAEKGTNKTPKCQPNDRKYQIPTLCLLEPAIQC
jgi:hypothetical protein